MLDTLFACATATKPGVRRNLAQLRAEVTEIHTLGPAGTNCEQAAYRWFVQEQREPNIVLHPSLEQAVEELCGRPGAALLGCIVYPKLHNIVFYNLHRLVLVDCFITPTHDMILATREDVVEIATVATHPAPSVLVPDTIPTLRMVDSNVQAAMDCAAGITDACITTLVAAEQHGLKLIRSFGMIEMGFTIHAQI